MLAQEAEIIHACSMRHLPLPTANEMELWEVASYLGLHRIETYEERDNREIVETKKEYFEETGEQRAEKLSGYSERRRASAIARARERTKEKAS